jgi:hypothetical protein
VRHRVRRQRRRPQRMGREGQGARPWCPPEWRIGGDGWWRWGSPSPAPEGGGGSDLCWAVQLLSPAMRPHVWGKKLPHGSMLCVGRSVAACGRPPQRAVRSGFSEPLDRLLPPLISVAPGSQLRQPAVAASPSHLRHGLLTTPWGVAWSTGVCSTRL